MEHRADYKHSWLAELDDKEKRLIEFIRQLGYGEIVIKIQDGLPMMVEKATEKIKL